MNLVLMRIGVGMVVVLAMAGALNFHHAVDERNDRFQAPWKTYMIGIGPERFREVIAMVPAEAVVGYISDLPDSGSERGPVRFLETQYALTPRVAIPLETLENPQMVWSLAFLQAQNALVPRLVIPLETLRKEARAVGNFLNAEIEREKPVQEKQHWVLGNFSKPMDLAQIERENRLNLVRDFGLGVVLFRSW